jgi:hypothetical protein
VVKINPVKLIAILFPVSLQIQNWYPDLKVVHIDVSRSTPDLVPMIVPFCSCRFWTGTLTWVLHRCDRLGVRQASRISASGGRSVHSARQAPDRNGRPFPLATEHRARQGLEAPQAQRASFSDMGRPKNSGAEGEPGRGGGSESNGELQAIVRFASGYITNGMGQARHIKLSCFRTSRTAYMQLWPKSFQSDFENSRLVYLCKND